MNLKAGTLNFIMAWYIIKPLYDVFDNILHKIKVFCINIIILSFRIITRSGKCG